MTVLKSLFLFYIHYVHILAAYCKSYQGTIQSLQINNHIKKENTDNSRTIKKSNQSNYNIKISASNERNAIYRCRNNHTNRILRRPQTSISAGNSRNQAAFGVACPKIRRSQIPRVDLKRDLEVLGREKRPNAACLWHPNSACATLMFVIAILQF